MKVPELPPWLSKALAPVLIFVAVASAISGVTQLLSWQNILPATAALSLIAGACAVHTWTARARPAGAGRRRVARFSLAARLLSLAAAVASLAGLASAAYVRLMPPPPPFAIDLLIDSSLDLPASGVNAVTAYFRQSGIRVAMRPVPIDARDTPGVITPAQVSDQFSGLTLADSFPGVRDRVTIWVTGLRLQGERYANLLAARYPTLSVVSARGVGQAASIGDPAVARYVAVSAVLEAAEVLAIRAGRELLPNRLGGVDRGCLLDIHELRETFVLATERPRLCDEEADGIARALGAPALKAITS